MPCNSNFGQNFELEITLDYFFELELSSISSLNYSETYFKLDSEEATHCHLICCVYIKGHVETVDSKDQSNAIVYGMFVDTVNMKIKACKCIECYVCRDCRYIGVCGSYTTPYTEYYEV